MENKCFLCMGVTDGLDNLINIHADEWKEDNIQDIIEKHLWSMESLKSKSPWLCSSCWMAVTKFHKFYKRIEDVQKNLQHVFMCEMKDYEILQNCTVAIEPDKSDNIPEIDIQPLRQENVNDLNQYANNFSPRRSDERKPKTGAYKCPSCRKILKNKEIMEFHTAWHAGKLVSCEICDLKFIERSALIEHRRIHAPSERTKNAVLSFNFNEPCSFISFSCDDQDFMDTTEETLDTETHSNESEYECYYCSKILENEQQVASHIAWHEGDVYHCKICYLKFVNLEKYKVHKNLHKAERNVTPDTSEFDEFSMESSTKAEENTIDFKEEKLEQESNCIISSDSFKRKPKTGAYKCPSCRKILKNKETIEFHTSWHGGKLVSCEICDLKFIDRSTLIEHKQIHAPSERTKNAVLSFNFNEPLSFISFSCDDQDFMDTTEETLDTETHSNESEYECYYCSKILENEQQVASHMAWHEGAVYHCKICYLKFVDLDKYKVHRNLHKAKRNVTPDTTSELNEDSMESSTEAEENTIDFKEENLEQESDYNISSDNFKRTKELKCQYCSTEFSHMQSYIKHRAQHEEHNEKGVKQENAEIKNSAKDLSNQEVTNESSDSSNLNKETLRSIAQHENFFVKELQQENPKIGTNLMEHLGIDLKKSSDSSNCLQENLRCDFCYMELETEKSLLNHTAWHEGNLLHCNKCDLRFFNETKFENHLLAHEKSATEPNLEDEESEDLMCTDCCKILSSRRLYLNHTAWHMGTIYQCEICDMKFLDKCHFDGHTETHMPKSWKRCRKCRKPFSCSAEVVLHYKKMHRNAVQNVCDVCGKNYHCPRSFKRHVDKHKGIIEEKLPCKICGRLLANKMCLKSHMKVNHPEGGILPYVCDICLKPIATRAMLKNHIRLYHATTGFEKKCFVCDKTFTHLAALKSHADTHASEKNYACQWCPEKFFASKMLSRHRKKVHPKEYAEWKRQQYVQM